MKQLELFSRIRDAKKAYDATMTEDEKNAARAVYQAVWDELKELGTAACRLFREYETSRDSGNEYLDISVMVRDNEAPGLIAAMRENGIEGSSFSPAGAAQWKPHGFFRKPDAPLRAWWRSTAGTPNSAAMSTRRPTGTFSESGIKAGAN